MGGNVAQLSLAAAENFTGRLIDPGHLLPLLRDAYRRRVVVGLDTECTPDDVLVCWSVGIPGADTFGSPPVLVAQPWVLLPEHVAALSQWLASSARKVAHAGSGDVHRLVHAGASSVSGLEDTLSLSRLVQPHEATHGLKDLAKRHLGYTPPGTFASLFRGKDLVRLTAERDPAWLKYAAGDAKYVAELWQSLQGLLARPLLTYDDIARRR